MLLRVPATLQSCLFSRLRFRLDLREDAPGGADLLLRLRRDLRQAGREVLGRGERFNALFDPPVADDPLARRRYQRPGPPFVILPPATMPLRLKAGDTLELTVVFWGRGRQGIADFIRVLETFGAIGLHRGEGRFDLAGVDGEAAGVFRPLWWPGQDPARLEIPFYDARWWLETAFPSSLPVRLNFRTPARLIANDRPLFRGDFQRLFPFILRRVTSMLHAHCAIEAIDDPGPLLFRAAQVEERENTLRWQDWRVLAGGAREQQLGGLAGSLRLDGPALGDLAWILRLGTLMNIGKGATFAAGSYLLE